MRFTHLDLFPNILKICDMKILSFYSDKVSDFDNNSVTLPSETIPDQSLSVQDILLRYARGDISLASRLDGDDDDIDAPSGYDDMVDAVDDYESSMRNVMSDVRSYSVATQRSNEDETASSVASPDE